MISEKAELETLVSFDFNEFKFRFGKSHVAGGHRIGRPSSKAPAHGAARSAAPGRFAVSLPCGDAHGSSLDWRKTAVKALASPSPSSSCSHHLAQCEVVRIRLFPVNGLSADACAESVSRVAAQGAGLRSARGAHF